MTEIKICGLTNAEDALSAAEAGADALGFIFFAGSPRYVHPEKARDISSQLPDWMIKVGVFVDAHQETVRRIRDFVGLDLIQLHGRESPDYCLGFDRSQIIKAVSSEKDLMPFSLNDYPVKAFLIDACDPVKRGGLGKVADWSFAKRLAQSYPVILAGGLNAGNVSAALMSVRPQAVDINSGVETAPGKKNPRLVKTIIETIRRNETIKNVANKIFLKPEGTILAKGEA